LATCGGLTPEANNPAAAKRTCSRQARAELERLPPHSPGHAELAAQYDQSTLEIDDRARRAWAADAKRSRP
jgi:hypothetical protein